MAVFKNVQSAQLRCITGPCRLLYYALARLQVDDAEAGMADGKVGDALPPRGQHPHQRKVPARRYHQSVTRKVPSLAVTVNVQPLCVP